MVSGGGPVPALVGRPIWRKLEGGGRELVAIMPTEPMPAPRVPWCRALLLVILGTLAGLALPALFLLLSLTE